MTDRPPGDRPPEGSETPLRDLWKSMVSFSWALSIFGMRSLGRMTEALTSPAEVRRAAADLDRVTEATREALGEDLEEVFEIGDRLQRGAADAFVGGALPGRPAAPTPPAPGPLPRALTPDSGRLDASTFVVLGEGWAAGMADFALREAWQRTSFPAQMAAQMGVELPQPLLQAPGLGEAPGFQRLPVRAPAAMQGTVLGDFPPQRPVRNLAIPGLTLADALELRPVPPLVHRHDARQTLANLVLGMPGLLDPAGDERGPTALEAAMALSPTFVVVELGFAEVLSAAVAGDATALPDPRTFTERYDRLLRALRGTGAQVLALTVPDPLDTAYCSTLETAGTVLRVHPGDLAAHWGLAPDDRLTLPGLDAVGFQIASGHREELGEGAVLAAGAAQRVREGVAAVNSAVAERANAHGALVFDLHGLVQGVAWQGVELDSRRLTAEHLGGFYSLDGYYPGATGQGVVAHQILAFLNDHCGARFPGVDLEALAREDPSAACRPASGPRLPPERLPRAEEPRRPPPQPPARRPTGRAGEPLVASKEVPPGPLELPPGLVQTLPLASGASYFGDGIRAVHCRSERDVGYGSCGDLLFGGLAMVDSHLSGEITLRFQPPVDGVSHFEVDFGPGFSGEDAVLAAPQGFRMPFLHNRADPVPGKVSSGDLVLATGEVRNLAVYAAYQSTALGLLVAVNPTFPRQPLSFPGQYGSAWARFDPRPDGLLDFSFYGSTFVPLGPGIRWPLNFAGADGAPATIPAAGTAMHPHLALSTREPEVPADVPPPDLPENTVREYTLFTHNSSFGDQFDLHSSDLGGSATGRSHLLGRLEIQFGERTGDSLPIAIQSLAPGGLLADVRPSPLIEAFPGRLYDGPHGFDEFLRFPLRTYYLDDVYILDDPFDVSVGLVDLRSGRAIGEILHRGFIGQDLIFALLRVEPRTPKGSFLFRGPTRFERSPGGGTVMRFKGEVDVPYPAGYAFPQPNLATAFVIGGESKLDPFYWLHAIDDEDSASGKSGGAEDVPASNGERFSYRYRMPADPAREASSFVYSNHTQGGRFHLRRLAWLDFADVGSGGSRPDTVTFSGFGVWEKDGVETRAQAAVQVSTAPGAAYVGIQIDGGAISNVNTKPTRISDALP